MKKSLLLFAAFVIFSYAKAQNIFPTSGNVGIGTTNPGYPLTVSGRIFANYLALLGNLGIGSQNDARIYLSNTTANTGQNWNLISHTDGSFQTGIYGINPFQVITSNGNIGIGTTTPNDKLEVFGVSRFSNPSNSNQFTQIYTAGAVSYFDGNSNSNVYNGVQHIFREGQNEKMRIDVSGNVGIGTTTPDQKLTVNGTIHSTQVKVDLSVPGPDYVFKKDYDLPELSKVKTYIDKNHHLSEIPSAAQMEKNGVDLGEMNIKLLKKVEELTLYLLDEHKKNAVQEKEIESLNQKVATLLNNSRIKE